MLYMSVVCTYHCRGGKGGGGASSEVGKANHSTSLLLIFTTEKVTKGAELQFCVHKVPSKVKE